uniref:CCSE2 protein n=1 Tax=Hymenolepis diminuta TaxID=6216 RepID=A0A0R3SK41_HYMDI
LTSSDSGGSSSVIGNPKESTSLIHKVPLPFTMAGNSAGFAAGGGIDKVPSTEHLIGDGGSPLPDSTAMLLKLHSRLGRILQEACELHKQIGHLLTATATGQQPP